MGGVGVLSQKVGVLSPTVGVLSSTVGVLSSGMSGNPHEYWGCGTFDFVKVFKVFKVFKVGKKPVS